MTTDWPREERLYNLLPTVYRSRDIEQGQALRALLAVVQSEMEVLEDDVAGLYANWFIETCDEWMIPYIADLLGVRLPHIIESADMLSLRAYVANTLAYRRRKGTVGVVEDLARTTTGWPAHAVEFFQLLDTTQHLNHVRPFNHRTPDFHDVNRLDLIGSAFERVAHTADIRRISTRGGRYNIPNLGIFLWRLGAYPLFQVAPKAEEGETGLYRFSPLGNDMPLFNLPLAEEHIGDLAQEQHVPTPIRPMAFYFDLRDYKQAQTALGAGERSLNSLYYGPDRSLMIYLDSVPVPPLSILCRNLEDWTDPAARPPEGYVAVDVSRGRLALPAGFDPSVTVTTSYCYGFSADLGGGPYDRRDSLARTDTDALERTDGDESAILHLEIEKNTSVATIQAALSAWIGAGKPPCIVRILDNAIYGGNIDIALPADGFLAIEAADGVRPLLRTVGTTTLSGPEGSRLRLGGLLISQGADLVLDGDLSLDLGHCTLVPGRSLEADGTPTQPDRDSIRAANATDAPQVTLIRCISGPLRLPESAYLSVRDSILDAPVPPTAQPRLAIAADDTGTEPGPITVLERVTVFGETYVRELSASESIFTDTVTVRHRQTGCTRFSYVPPGSRTSRRYRCQPDLALDGIDDDPTREVIRQRLIPHFTSSTYGQPAYAQLAQTCAKEIRTGAEDGAEMGAFHLLMQPQREANLRAALDEYLRFGIEAGLFYVT